MAVIQKITLVDRGQDFLEWYVRDGIVIDCKPFSGMVWVGTLIEEPEGPVQVGGILHIRTRSNRTLTTLNYPVAALRKLTGAKAVEVEARGLAWALKKGIPASDLGLQHA